MSEKTNGQSPKPGGIIITLILLILMIVKFGFRQSNKKEKIPSLEISALMPNKFLENYSPCATSIYPASCDSIQSVWKKYKSSKTEVLDKIMLLAPSYIEAFKVKLNDALYLNKSGFEQLNLMDKIKIVEFRSALLSTFKPEELAAKKDKDLIPEFLFIQIGSMDRESFSDLGGVKFINKNKAVGFHTVLGGRQRGVTFEKSEGVWKINDYDEGDDFIPRRRNDQKRILQQYGGAKKFIELAYGEHEDYYRQLKSK